MTNYLLGTLFATGIGAILPWLKPWSERQLHLFLAAAAGVLLGAAFLHILPEAGADGFAGKDGAMVLAGFLAILLIERVLLAQHERVCGVSCGHAHAVVGYAAFIGLSAHSIADGLGLALGIADVHVGAALFMAIVAHKAMDAFSLATVFRLANFPLKRSAFFLTLFALITPLAALATNFVFHRIPFASLRVAISLAAGTFLYVATCDLLPEAFHDNRGRIGSFAALLAGIVVMMAMTLVHG